MQLAAVRGRQRPRQLARWHLDAQLLCQPPGSALQPCTSGVDMRGRGGGVWQQGGGCALRQRSLAAPAKPPGHPLQPPRQWAGWCKACTQPCPAHLQKALPRLQVLRNRQVPLAGPNLLGSAPALNQQPAVEAEHPHVDGAVQQACRGWADSCRVNSSSTTREEHSATGHSGEGAAAADRSAATPSHAGGKAPHHTLGSPAQGLPPCHRFVPTSPPACSHPCGAPRSAAPAPPPGRLHPPGQSTLPCLPCLMRRLRA